MEELVALLTSKKLTISSCESLTAGLFASSIASISGASAVLYGGLVTYQNEIKINVANVDASIIEEYGVISKECAIEMAKCTRKIMKSDLCVSFTGNAGPSTMEGKAAGLVYCAIAGPSGIQTYEFHFQMQRNELREQVVCEMSKNVIQYIQSMH
ncbi:CinA family protein [Amedibacillus sp. YH-ame10]